MALYPGAGFTGAHLEDFFSPYFAGAFSGTMPSSSAMSRERLRDRWGFTRAQRRACGRLC